MHRPRPEWWIHLPVGVEASTLAAHLQTYATHCTGSAEDMPQRAILQTAALIDACVPTDVQCFRSVVAQLDARAAAARDDGEQSERRAWSALAHAVWRVAEAVADANQQRAPYRD